LRENHFVPYSLIGKILELDKRTVKYHYKWYETVGPLASRNGSPPLVAEERREELIQRIEEADQRGIPWTIGEILEFVQEKVTRTL
jgi:transposase